MLGRNFVMSKEQKVKDFYSKIQFPGPYKISQLKINTSPYIQFYNNAVQGLNDCLDIGCGTGMISNCLAKNNHNIHFDAVDFCDSIYYAKTFAQKHKIKNIIYYKKDFLSYPTKKKYDLILCTGVLHHIPDYLSAIKLIKNLAKRKIVIGIYNTYAKKIQKIIKPKFTNKIYRLDQEEVPFQTSFDNRQILDLFSEYYCNSIHPSINNSVVDFRNLFNYRNGGLTLYEFERK